MDHDIVAGLLWGMLASSAMLTIAGAGLRSWQLLAIAAWFSGVFAIAALPSIGLFVLIVTVLQAAAAVGLRRWERSHANGKH